MNILTDTKLKYNNKVGISTVCEGLSSSYTIYSITTLAYLLVYISF